jgi:hypothetical protein
MAADDRRIITGTHVVAKEGNIMEDATVHKYVIDSTVGKALGGKSIVTDVANTQDFAGTSGEWYRGDNKSTQLSIGGVTMPTGTDATDTGDVQFLYVRNLDATLDCYISLTTTQTWATGWSDGDGSPNTTVEEADQGKWDFGTYSSRNPSYNGRWDEGMYLIVPPGGSVQLRGDSTGHLNLDHIRFRSSDGTTPMNIEYVLAE